LITLSTTCVDGVWFAVALNTSGEVVHASFSPKKKALLRDIIGSIPPTSKVRRDDSEGHHVLKHLGRLFRGEEVSPVPRIDLSSITEFQRAVYTATGKIPKGKVLTYSMLAEAIGCRHGYRAVGNALASNPFPLIVPCHRVVHSNLKIGGYSIPGLGRREALQLKGRILMSEGVEFEGERVASRYLLGPKP